MNKKNKESNDKEMTNRTKRYHYYNNKYKNKDKTKENNSFIIDIKGIKKEIVKEQYTSKRTQSCNMSRCKMNISKANLKNIDNGSVIEKKLIRSQSYKEKYTSKFSSKNNSMILNRSNHKSLSSSIKGKKINKEQNTNKTLLLQTKKDMNNIKDNAIFRCNQKFSELSVIHNLFLVRKLNNQKQTTPSIIYKKKEQPIRVIEQKRSINQTNTIKKKVIYNFNDLDKEANSFFQSSMNLSNIPKISNDIIEQKNKKMNEILSKANINVM